VSKAPPIPRRMAAIIRAHLILFMRKVLRGDDYKFAKKPERKKGLAGIVDAVKGNL